jgi:hypothetical protein
MLFHIGESHGQGYNAVDPVLPTGDQAGLVNVESLPSPGIDEPIASHHHYGTALAELEKV